MILKTPGLYYDFSYFYTRSETQTSTTVVTTMSNQLSIQHQFNPVFAGNAQLQRVDDHSPSGDRVTLRFGGQLTAVPLRTLSHSLGLSSSTEQSPTGRTKNNAVTLTLLELGRLKFFADVMGVSRVEDIRFILAEAVVRYRIPILLQDPVRLRMTVTDISRSSFRFFCELFDPRDGRVFTEAETVQVMYDYAAGRPAPLSREYEEVLRDYLAG